jgi:Cytochrome domain of cellobiose dehydrogenase
LTGVTFRRYYNADVDTSWGYIFPPTTGETDDFVGIFQAPASAGWIGNSLGGGMRNAPLLLGWVDNGNPKLSVRWAT